MRVFKVGGIWHCGLWLWHFSFCRRRNPLPVWQDVAVILAFAAGISAFGYLTIEALQDAIGFYPVAREYALLWLSEIA